MLCRLFRDVRQTILTLRSVVRILQSANSLDPKDFE